MVRYFFKLFFYFLLNIFTPLYLQYFVFFVLFFSALDTSKFFFSIIILLCFWRSFDKQKVIGTCRVQLFCILVSSLWYIFSFFPIWPSRRALCGYLLLLDTYLCTFLLFRRCCRTQGGILGCIWCYRTRMTNIIGCWLTPNTIFIN